MPLQSSTHRESDIVLITRACIAQLALTLELLSRYCTSAQLSRGCCTCRVEAANLSAQLSTAQTQFTKVGEERAAHVQALREEVAAADKRHADHIQEVEGWASNLEQQMQVASQSSSDANAKAATLKEQSTSAQQALQASAATAAALHKELGAQKSSARQDLDASKAEASSQIGAANAASDDAQSRADTLSQQLDSISTERNNLMQRVAAAEEQHRAAAGQCDFLFKQLAETKTSQQVLLSKLQAESGQRLIAAEDAQVASAAEVKQLSTQVADLKKQIEGAEVEQKQLAASKDAETSALAKQANADQQAANTKLQTSE